MVYLKRLLTTTFLKGQDVQNVLGAIIPRKSIEWLNYVATTQNIFIQHAENIGEFIIPQTNYRVDGYCKETNTIYEFYGDYWHGNPKRFKPEEYCHPLNSNITAKELYEQTLVRETNIKSKGYFLVTIWENEWETLVT